MKRAALLAIGCLAASVAMGGPRCRTDDSWRGPDKNLHFGVGTFAALAVTGATKDPMKAWLVTTAAAGAWELAPLVLKKGDCSLQDLVAGTVGAALGAAIGGLSLRVGGGEVQVTYVAQF